MAHINKELISNEERGYKHTDGVWITVVSQIEPSEKLQYPGKWGIKFKKEE